MNRLPGIIVKIESMENYLNFLTIQSGPFFFTAVTLQLLPEFRLNSPVNILFKETAVALVQGENIVCSIENIFPVKIKSIKSGEKLTEVKVESAAGEITAVITNGAAQRLAVQPELRLYALLKATDLSLETGGETHA